MEGDDHAWLGEAAGEGSLGHTWRRGSDHVRVEQRTEAGGTGPGPRIGSRGGGHGKCDGQEGSPDRLLRMSGDGCGQVKGES